MDPAKQNRLKIIGPAQRPGYVLCRCECGKEKEVRKAHMTAGRTLSCGCLRQELSIQRATTHGQFGTPEHSSWAGMLDRCRNPNCRSFARYGARGIRVCDRWLDFANFLADMGKRPGPGYSLDRIDPNGHYEPDNCRWATQTEQARNKRRHAVVELPSGERLSTWEYAERIGLSRKAAWEHAERLGLLRNLANQTA